MVHEAMVLEYGAAPRADGTVRRDQAPALRVADRLPVRALGHHPAGRRARSHADRRCRLCRQARRRSFLLAVFETSIAKMRVFRVPEFLGAALMLALLATLLMFLARSR